MTIDYEREAKADKTRREQQGLAKLAAKSLGADLPGGSPLTAIVQVAEAAEEGLVNPDVQQRLERFPELDVEVPTGNAARFPELASPAPAAAPASEEEVELGR